MPVPAAARLHKVCATNNVLILQCDYYSVLRRHAGFELKHVAKEAPARQLALLAFIWPAASEIYATAVMVSWITKRARKV